MDTEQSEKILKEVKTNFIYDFKTGIPNLLRKSAIDIKMKLAEILGTDDPKELEEGKKFVNQTAEIMGNDLVQQLVDNVEKY